MQKRLYPHWKETVVFSTEGPQPQTLFETEKSRAVIAGLEAGQKIPPHTEGLAIFHYLEGTGQMIVDEEHFPVQTGATVVVPDGARNTLTYNIPAVNCMHCKMTIEREVGVHSGVGSVSVDVDTKQAVIKFDSLSTKAEIEALLTKIGYPPESQ